MTVRLGCIAPRRAYARNRSEAGKRHTVCSGGEGVAPADRARRLAVQVQPLVYAVPVEHVQARRQPRRRLPVLLHVAQAHRAPLGRLAGGGVPRTGSGPSGSAAAVATSELANGEFTESEMRKIMANERLAELALADPKRVKRFEF